MPVKIVPSKIVSASIALVVCFIAGTPAYSQVDAGSIRGNVTDPTGAVVPSAKVTLTNDETGLAVDTTTSQGGNYSFTPVKIGVYTLEVEASGFTKAAQRKINVDVQQQVKADIKLATGSVSQTVEVNAVAALLQTQDASVGNIATREQINNLPLNGRNYTFLAQLGPGVTGIGASRGLDKTGSFVANGLTTVHNNYILDGIDNNNDTVDFLNGAAYVNLPPPDAIEEFKVQTSNFSAEFGRAGGAVVNATIKSGSNSLHGSLWEFLRNDALDATDQYFTNPKIKKGKLRQNQFGGAVGGPIFKNKTFFFGDYDGTRIRQGALRTASVPTVVERASGYTDFRDLIAITGGTAKDNLGRLFPLATIFDPATTRAVTAGLVDPATGLVATSTGFVRNPFYTAGSVAGITDFTSPARQALLNQLPAGRLDANAIKLLNLYPGATQPGISSNFSINRPQPLNSNHFDTRIDQNFSQHDQMFGRVSYSRRSENILPAITGPGDNSGFGQGAVKTSSMNVAISETHAFSETMINEARFGYSKLRDAFEPAIAQQLGIPAQFGIGGIPQTPGNGGLPTISIRGLTDLGAGAFASPNRRRNDTVQITENLTKTHGAHTFKGGFEYQRLSFPWIDPAWSRGALTFGGYTGVPNGASPGVGAADILLSPTPSTVAGGVNNVGGPNGIFSSNVTEPDDLRHYYGTYLQDDWKVSPKLTANLGLRWEMFGALGEAKGRQAALDPGAPNGAGAVYQILAKQKNVPLSPLFVQQLAKDGIALKYLNDSSVSTTPKTNFAPRVGLAYQIFDRVVLRAGYGVFFAGFENLGGSPDPGYNYPFAVNLSLFSPNDSSPLVYANGTNATLEYGLTGASANPDSPSFSPNGLGLGGFQRNWKTGYTQQWNLSTQYQFSPSQSLTIAYVANNSHHIINTDKRNVPTQILPPGTDQSKHVAFQDFGRGLDYIAADGDAQYGSLQTSFEQRFSKGVNFLVNYTHSRCKTDVRNSLQIGEGAIQRGFLLPGFGIKKDYAYCGNDVRDAFHTSGIFQLPFGAGQRFAGAAKGAVNEIIGGWSTQWVYTLQDGFPFSVGCPISTTAGLGCYANQVSGQKLYSHVGPHGITRFLNPAAFTNPPVATTIGQSDYSPLGSHPTQVAGPGYSNLDFSVFKEFPTSEKTRIQFRSEFFNILNHPNFSNSFRTLDFRSQDFGVINGTRGSARQVQMALKFYF